MDPVNETSLIVPNALNEPPPVAPTTTPRSPSAAQSVDAEPFSASTEAFSPSASSTKKYKRPIPKKRRGSSSAQTVPAAPVASDTPPTIQPRQRSSVTQSASTAVSSNRSPSAAPFPSDEQVTRKHNKQLPKPRSSATRSARPSAAPSASHALSASESPSNLYSSIYDGTNNRAPIKRMIARNNVLARAPNISL